MINFGIIDYILLAAYFAGVLFIGFRTRINSRSEVDYLVAGRKLTLPAFVATLVSTFYGGILGVGEFTYKFGISGWFLYAFPYYVFILIFALFLAGRIRRTKLYTIPDKLELTYGRKAGVFGAFMVFLLVTPAPYVFMLGILTELIFGIGLFYAMVICLVISVAYLVKGGLTADVRVNIFEFILMFAGFSIIIPFCFTNLGGLEFLVQNLPDKHTSLTGGNTMIYILAWFFIGSWALVDPAFHQRCYAAESEKTARNGVLVSLIFWIIFDFLTTLSGLYAVAHIKNIENPVMSYPLLANDILPQAAKGFFFIGMIATIMSTLHSNLFISATTLGKDIISRIKGNNDNDNKLTKFGIIITSAVSLLIAILLPSVVEIWYAVGSMTIPPLLIGLISSYFRRLHIKSGWILSAMIVSFLFSFIWIIFSIGYAEPYFAGTGSGLMVYAAGYGISKRKAVI